MKGSESTNTSAITPGGSPFPSRPESCLATCWMSISDVSAASAKTSGATCWRRRYRLMVRTMGGAIIFGSPSLYKTSLPCDHSKEPPLARGSLGQPRLPGPGANDGASGVALLLGVADALKAKPPTVGVDLLFVDGEDYGDFATDSNDVLIGSRYFASHQPPGYQPLFAVLFDMVADKDQQFYYEGNSQAVAPEVVDRVWHVAADLGYGRVFIPGVKHTLTDDHVALQKVGIHTIDVVDFDYPYWHTTDDTIDKVSAASLQVVGDVAVALVR